MVDDDGIERKLRYGVLPEASVLENLLHERTEDLRKVPTTIPAMLEVREEEEEHGNDEEDDEEDGEEDGEEEDGEEGEEEGGDHGGEEAGEEDDEEEYGEEGGEEDGEDGEEAVRRTPSPAPTLDNDDDQGEGGEDGDLRGRPSPPPSRDWQERIDKSAPCRADALHSCKCTYPCGDCKCLPSMSENGCIFGSVESL